MGGSSVVDRPLGPGTKGNSDTFMTTEPYAAKICDIHKKTSLARTVKEHQICPRVIFGNLNPPAIFR